jgi:hypothetical protein
MLKWLIKKRLTAFEKQFGYDASYARDILATDLRAFLVLARSSGFGNYRRDVPRDVYWAVRLVGIVTEDCGPCTQLSVAMALADRADPRLLAAVLANDDAALTDDVRLGMRFARAALARVPEVDELRDEVAKRWGRRALVALVFAITAARIYPTIKYGLGYGRTCQRVVVAGETIAVVRATHDRAGEAVAAREAVA